MPSGLSLWDQYEIATKSWETGDFDLFKKLLTSPESITLAENRSMAEKLGFKGGFLNAAVNVVSDPTVWLATFLSRKFPTKQYIQGTIPHRFVGAGKEFTGISNFSRSINRFFLGSNMPNLVSLQMRRKAEVMKVGNSIFDLTLSRSRWKDEKPIVSLLLEGQNPPGATPALRELAGKVRSHMDEMWGFLSKAKKIDGGIDDSGQISLAQVVGDVGGNPPQYLRDYLPHMPLWGTESLMEMDPIKAVGKFGRGRLTQILEATGVDAKNVWTQDSLGRLSSNYNNFQSFMNGGGQRVLNSRLFKRVRTGIPLQSSQGQDLFVTDLDLVLEKYVNSVAHTYSNYAPLSDLERTIAASSVEGADGIVRTIMPTNEPLMVQVINEGLRSTGGQFGRRFIQGTQLTRDTLIPGTANKISLKSLTTLIRQLEGKEDEGSIMMSGIFNWGRDRLHSWTGLDDKRKGQINAAMATMEHSRTMDRAISGGIVSHLYAATLGMNPGAAIRNLFQPFITTIPTIGLGPTLAGYKEWGLKLPQYKRAFSKSFKANPDLPGGFIARSNLALDQALREAYPELAELGIKADPKYFDLHTGPTGDMPQFFRRMDDYYKFVMHPFTQSEQVNQIATFYGARNALVNGLKRGEVDYPHLPDNTTPLVGQQLDTWLNAKAGDTVSATQFRPGPGTMTPFQTNLHPVLRMFSGFPMRAYNHIANSTINGALTDKQLQFSGALSKLTQGRNLGGVARTYLYGRVLTEGLRETLGVDMQGALGVMAPFDINPTGNDLMPFAVPPALSLIAGTVGYAATRDIKRLQPLNLPMIGEVPLPKLMFPGGVGISKMARAYNQFSPDLGGFVDENDRLMYKAGAPDLAMAMLGIPLDKERRMRETLDRVQQVKWRIRDMKRQQAHASISGDWKKVDAVAAQYQEEFPEFAQMAPLAPTIKDIKRYQNERNISVVQRMLQGLSKEIGTDWEVQLEDYDPELLGQRF